MRAEIWYAELGGRAAVALMHAWMFQRHFARTGTFIEDNFRWAETWTEDWSNG